MDYDFDKDNDFADEEYYLGSKGKTELYWVKKASVGADNVLNPAVNRTDYGNWFNINDDESIKSVFSGGSLGGSSIYFKTPSVSDVVGELAYQFDFTYQENDAPYYTEEGFSINIDSKQFYLKNTGVKSINDGDKTETYAYVQTGEGKYEMRKTAVINSYIASGAEKDTPYYVKAADRDKYLKSSTFNEGGVWHTTMIRINMIESYYTIYFDGKPVYFITNSSGGYGCRIRLDNSSKLPTIWLATNRLCTFANRIPYFDNFKGYYVKHVVKGKDITDLSGFTKSFGQNFDDESITVGTRVTTAMGFKTVSDTATKANARYTIKYDEITDLPETSNRVMEAKPNITMARATEAQYKALQESDTTVTWSGKTYKVIDFTYGYYLALPCTTRNASLYWFDKSYVTNGALPATTSRDVEYGSWFSVDSDGQISGIVKNPSGASFQIPAPSEGVGSYAVQFDFAYPGNGNLYCGEEGFDIQIDSNQFHIRANGIVRSGTGTKTRKLIFAEGETSVESENVNKTVPKITVDTAHYFSSADAASNLTTVSPMYRDGEWNTLMIYYNLDKAYYTFYINGLPVYAKAENGGYSCRYVLEKTAPAVTNVGTNRYCVYNDHAPVFDNFLVYESLGTDEEIADRILSNIKIPYIDDFEVITGDIVFDSEESKLVTWSFSNNTFVIDKDDPLIARYNAPFGKGTSKVTLTATCKYGTATKTKDFVLTVQDKPKYTVNTVLMKDANGNRIYRPLDNSMIESVSYTANTNVAAEMYLAVYDVEGRLVSATKKPAENGIITFNQPINANETYKVFLWENNTVTPLAEYKEDDYIESENPTIFVIGDSIAESYSEANNLRGWGQYLYKAFNDKVKVVNKAAGGRTTKYALAEDRLKYVLNNCKPGDYLFVMLGHNDQKQKDTTYHCASLDEYKFLLEAYANAAKAKGVTTVFVTSLTRTSWGNNKQPDANGKYVVNLSLGSYPAAMKAVAEKTGMPVIDIHAMSRACLAECGPTKLAELGYYNPNDSHTLSAGADWVVGMIADELATMNLPISEFLK